MISRRLLLCFLCYLPFIGRSKNMEDIEVLGCKIKRDRLYRVNEDRMLFQWVKEEGKGIYSIGFMQVLSSLIYPIYAVKLKPPGTILDYDDNLAVIEAGKRVSTFPSPIGGKIVEVNKSVEREPSQIVNAPYEAWLVKLESRDFENLRRLKKAEEVAPIVKNIILKEKIECLPKKIGRGWQAGAAPGLQIPWEVLMGPSEGSIPSLSRHFFKTKD